MGDLEKLVAPDPQKAVERSRGGTTSKKLKAISHRKLLDTETGEVVEVGHVELQGRDANFEKIWLGHIIDAIDEIGSKKIEVLMWLFRNRNAENIVIATNKEIAEEIGVSYDTVATTMSALTKHDIIKRGVGHVRINPNVIFKGAYQQRMSILLTYAKAGEPKVEVNKAQSADQKIDEIVKE
ncbi:replication/maintenance protein RepL, partial [Citrobacter sp. VF227]